MGKYTMENNDLQGYFQIICQSYYLAYIQLKRIKDKERELDDEMPYDELEMVNELLQISLPKKVKNKYITQKYSNKQLKERKKELELMEKDVQEKIEFLSYPSRFWGNELCKRREEIAKIIKIMVEENFTIIVSCREEIIALMDFFRYNSVKEYRIMNVEDECLICFPTKEKVYRDFYQAYCLEDEEGMKRVCKEYF